MHLIAYLSFISHRTVIDTDHCIVIINDLDVCRKNEIHVKVCKVMKIKYKDIYRQNLNIEYNMVSNRLNYLLLICVLLFQESEMAR